MTGKVQNGASIIRAGDFIDSTAIPATISLPAAVWERLTADLRDDDRESLGRPELPDTPLESRIATFLEMELIGWEASYDEGANSNNTPGGDNGSDDGLPF